MTGQEAIAIVKSLGISQAEFARRAGVTPHAVTQWTRGGPPSSTMAALLRLLEKRPELINVLEPQP